MTTRAGAPFENVEELIRRVYAYAAARLGPGADAEDVTSAVFERAVAYASSFDPARGTPIAWLLGIARRVLSEHRVSQPLPASDGEREPAEPGDLAEAAADRLDVWGAVARLDEADRELIALRYASDLTARQIASLLGQRTNTVEVALHRALHRLRGELAGRRETPVRVHSVAAVFTPTAPNSAPRRP